ncbi:MAG: flagellar basal body P-ring formation chaperone FlgA [Phycisphaerales bacterium JB050]
MNTLTRIILTVLIALVLSGIALADSVRLKRAAIVEPDQTIRLIDVAELEGAYASTLARLVICDEASELLGATGTGEVTLQQVRRVLHEQKAAMGQLTLSGRTCSLRPVSGMRRTEEEQEETTKSWRTIEDWAHASEPTVEILIVRAFARELKIEPDRLRLRFLDAPEGLLELPATSMRTVVKPISTYSSAIALLKVQRYRGSGSMDREETIKVEVQVLRPVLKLREQVSRREPIPGGVLEATQEWLSADVDAVPAAEAYEYVGQIATTRLTAGTMLLRSHVEKPIAVERNSAVIIIYHGDGFLIESAGRSREDGREGEIIEVQLTESKKTVLARVDGPQRVIVVTR